MQHVFPPHPVIVMAAPNGARRTKADHPAIPITAAEIAADARLCEEAGAAAFHLHVRDDEGRHSLDPRGYAEAISAIRAATGDDLVIQITTEAAGVFAPPAQMDAVRGCDPDAVSIAMREFVAAGGDGAEFAAFLAETLARGIAVQIILYDAHDLARLNAIVLQHKLDSARLSVLYVLGRYVEHQTATPDALLPFLVAREPAEHVPFRDAMVCAFGRHEHACVMAGALFGAHVRVGFENNFHLIGGDIAPGTHTLVAQACRALHGNGLRTATPRETRGIWGIGGG
jgi:uncharacterized protein (DUF849 family)